MRTAVSVAFSVLRARAALLGEPAPTLISGPEQDLVLAELLAGHVAGEGVPVAWPAKVPVEALRPARVPGRAARPPDARGGARPAPR